MWYGEMTSELDELYDRYDEIFGNYPDAYDDLEYGPDDYDDYVADIKKAIEEKKELPHVADYIPDE